MKACSFLPAVTQMIYDMGLESHLYGVTFECPPVARNEKQIVVRCELEGRSYTSEEINAIFSASKAEGNSLYHVDDRVLSSIMPDVIFTQDLCEVCQIDTGGTSAAIARLDKEVKLVAISPDDLEDVFSSAYTIASAFHQEEKATAYLKRLHQRTDKVVDIQRANGLKPKRVSLLEWVDPIYNCGHWIPDQIARAGGIDRLSRPAGDSTVISWAQLVTYDPEILVIAPCGYKTDRTLEDIHCLSDREEWASLTAVKNKAVYVIDFELFTQPSARTLVEGIEILAACFHPDEFTLPKHSKPKVRSLYETAKTHF